jgi:hypothetical protein
MNRYLSIKRRIANRAVVSFTCSKCGHGVLVHKNARPEFLKYSVEQLGAMVRIDLDLRKRTLPLCDITICDDCVLADLLKCVDETGDIHK